MKITATRTLRRLGRSVFAGLMAGFVFPVLLNAQSSPAVDATATELRQAMETVSDDGCLPDDYPIHPAAGVWTGSFWVEYEPSIQGMTLPMKMRARWQGTLKFEIKRFGESVLDPKDDGTAVGTADAAMVAKVDLRVPDATAAGNSRSMQSVVLELSGKEEDPDFEFRYLLLKHEPMEAMAMSTHTSVVTADDGRMDKSATTNGEAAPTTGGGTAQKITWFRLNIEDKSCAAMLGTVDRSLFEAMLKQWGMNGVVVDSNWAATRDDEDKDFAQRVRQALARPVPTLPTSNDLKEGVDEYLELRGEASKLDDYRACLLRPLLNKQIRLVIKFLKREVEFLQTVADNNFAIFNAVILPAMQGIKFLEALGVPNCPIEFRLRAEIQKKFEDMLQVMLGKNPTRSDLLTVNQALSTGMFRLGRAEAPFKKAWTAAGMPGEPGP